jgi:methionyl aminopeptidase
MEPLTLVNSDPRRIVRHGPEGFEGMRRAGRLVAECLDALTPHVQPGVTTERLDELARAFILDHGAVPACLFYRGYRHTICTSVNHVVCHGMPSAKPLREGDIFNLDVTLILDGWHGDHSRMYAVGRVKRLAERLIETTYEAMMAGIAAVRPGRTVGDIGAAVEAIAHANRFSVVHEFCGHGIGRVFHAGPNIVHVGPAGSGEELHEGMFFTVEPMINVGRPDTHVLNDGWTAITRDRSLSAQFEHTVGVTADGVEIFTLSPAGLDRPPYAVG